MSGVVKQVRATATTKTVSKKVKARRSSSPLEDERAVARPTKRAKITKDESMEESQITMVSKQVTTLKLKEGSTIIEESQATLVEESSQPKATTKAPRKKKTTAEPSPADFPPRVNLEWKVGAHISAAGGIEQAITNAAKIGAEAFALFLKSQRQWTSKPLTPASISSFKSRMETFGYDYKNILPHGSYLVNLGNPDEEKREKSYECFLDDLMRCEQVGIGLYNFHPGSTVGACTIDESISHIAESLNRAHKATSSVVTVVENMAGSGNVLGCTFDQLAKIIALVEDKKRVGICLDTCHLFASGYDIRTKETYEATMAEFGQRVGFQYLRGLHLNDSKTNLNSKKDRHEHLGLGHIGLRAFGFLMRDERIKNIPMVLETPTEEVWPKEVAILQKMADASIPESDLDFDAMTEEVRVEVKKYEKEPVKKEKKETAAKKGKAPAKRKKGKKEESDSDQDDED